MWVVQGLDDNPMRANRREQVGDVDHERGVAPLVGPGEAAIDPDVCRKIDRAEVEGDPLTGRGQRRVKGAAVPDSAGEILISDTGQWRFGREGNADSAVERHLVWVVDDAIPIEGELPLTVERSPAATLELRARIGGREHGHILTLGACSTFARSPEVVGEGTFPR